tara:strand:+ start:342 stop:581 length:240 start_codon:yes stop_codon:yes gene_type:complete
MTIKELRNMTRREQIGILADAMENKNKLLSKLVVSVMAESQIDTSSENTKRKPMLTKKKVNETNAQRSERLNFLRRIND